MREPKTELRSYLDKLMYRYLNIKSLRREIRIISSWKDKSNVSVVEAGAYFLALVNYSFWRIILVELAMLLSDSEQKSLLDWLKKAREHASPLEPARFITNASDDRHELIRPREYREIIDKQLAQIGSLQSTIDRVKGHRDKAIAHLDRIYFNNPERLYTDFPLGDADVEDLFKLVESILATHYLYLFKAGVKLEVASVSTVDTLLRYAEAFLKVRMDRDLIARGFRPVDYLEEA